MVPGGAPLSEAEWDARIRQWLPELADTRLRQVTWPAIELYHEFIREQLQAGSPSRRSISGCATSTAWR